jgi:hypothetical protein
MTERDPRTAKRIRNAERIRLKYRHLDEFTRKAIDRIIHHFVCPDPVVQK